MSTPVISKWPNCVSVVQNELGHWRPAFHHVLLVPQQFYCLVALNLFINLMFKAPFLVFLCHGGL